MPNSQTPTQVEDVSIHLNLFSQLIYAETKDPSNKEQRSKYVTLWKDRGNFGTTGATDDC